MFNKDTFSGKDITKPSDTDWEVAQKRADWIFKQIVPNAPFIPGSWNFDKLMNGTANVFETEMAGYTGYTKSGDAIPLGFALLDVAGGTKIRSFDPERSKDFKEYEIDKERKEVNANIRSANRNRAMTEAKRQRYVAEQREKLEELTRKREALQ
ncbi:MAG TPA: hypothetical protein VHB01_04415 [Nitrosospira sp.]|nr:hypothetical protein [Nitrosospira sp.]